MTEMMLADVDAASSLRYVALRYFNVAGADPLGRAGQSSRTPTHLIKVACQAAVGQRKRLSVFGTDYPTHDGTCIRDYIHVTDLAAAHLRALDYLRSGGGSDVFNCGYSRGYSVLEVIDTLRRVSGVDILVDVAGRRPGDPAVLVARSAKIRQQLGWHPKLDDLETIIRHALVWERKIAAAQIAA